MLKVINVLLMLGVLINAFYLTNQRFKERQFYTNLAVLQNKADSLNKEYTRLQLEAGTYSSDLAIQNYAAHNLSLIQPDKQHVVELK